MAGAGLSPNVTEGEEPPSLCVFADASQNAFGSCAYLRQKRNDGTYTVKFIAGKSRVAPLKQLIIPRLELQAAVVASRLAKSIQEESRIEFGIVTFFIDNTIVLAWIQSPSRAFKPFVSSRIGEIQSNSDPNQWKHIPSEVNVADDLSRGITVKELNNRWVNGPEFLRLPEEEWPIHVTTPSGADKKIECLQVAVVKEVKKVAADAIDLERFSSWRKLIRVTAHIKRFAEKIRTRKYAQEGRQGPLNPEEFWIRRAQENLNPRIKKGDFKALSPFLDETGVIRVGGRVKVPIRDIFFLSL